MTNFAKFMHDHPWIFGLIMIIGGPIVALSGQRFFPWVMTGIVSISLSLGILIFCSMIGIMETTVGLCISIGVALVSTLLSGWLVMKTVWIAIGILGLVGGFFLGTMIYTIFLAAFHHGALWVMVCFSILCAIIGGLLSFKYSQMVVLICTSLIGSYSFMRGLSYFFGGYPPEAELYESLKN